MCPNANSEVLPVISHATCCTVSNLLNLHGENQIWIYRSPETDTLLLRIRGDNSITMTPRGAPSATYTGTYTTQRTLTGHDHSCTTTKREDETIMKVDIRYKSSWLNQITRAWSQWLHSCYSYMCSCKDSHLHLHAVFFIIYVGRELSSCLLANSKRFFLLKFEKLSQKDCIITDASLSWNA